MFKKSIVIFFLFTNFSFATEVWNSEEGLKRLSRSQFKNDFYQLVNFFQPQINPIYCGAASSVMILNAFNYGKIASQKKVNREQDMQIRNHDLRVAHRRRGGAGNTTAASTKWRRIRRTGATGKRRLRRGAHEIQRCWRPTDGGRGKRAQR